MSLSSRFCFKQLQIKNGLFSSLAWREGILLALIVIAWPLPAFAEGEDATTLGDLICNVKENLKAYPYILDASAYVIGLFLAIRGIFLLKKHAENTSQPQVVPAVAHLIGAGTLMALPAVTGVIQRSVFGEGAGAGNFGCAAGTSGSSGGASLDVMMQNFVKDIHQPISILLSLISVAVGLTFIVSALLRGTKTGADPRAADPKGIIANLVFGAILISIGTVLPDMLKSIFGSDSVSNLSEAGKGLINWSKIAGSGANTEAADKTVAAVLGFVQIIGLISFLRGWLILKKVVEGGGQVTYAQGFTHVIGGAMAINIDVMIKVIDKTFGTGLIN